MELKTYSATDLSRMDKRYRTEFVNALSGAKPAMLVGTTDKDSMQQNLALVSNVLHVGANPPLLGILFRPDVVPRHSLSNIRRTGFFTRNHVYEGFVDKAHLTTAKFDQHTSEFKKAGLDPDFTHTLSAPYVKQAHVQIGLKLEEQIDIAANGTHFVIGRIIEVRLPESAVKSDGYIALDELGSVSVVGLQGYQKLQPHTRLGYIRPGQSPDEVAK